MPMSRSTIMTRTTPLRGIRADRACRRLPTRRMSGRGPSSARTSPDKGGPPMATEGLTTIKSGFSPKETSDRLRREIFPAGMTLFASIDHAAAAAEVGLTLRPTELLIFGNAKGGTPLMQQSQVIGID